MQYLFHVAVGADRAELTEADSLEAVRASGGWLWLDVVDFSGEEALAIARVFGFDPIAMEDVTDLTEFPKVDDYRDHAFVVAHGVTPDPARAPPSRGPGRAAASRWWRAWSSGCSTWKPGPWPGTAP